MVLEGKVAIVTGTGRRLGKATSSAFVSQGARVMLMSLEDEVAPRQFYCPRPPPAA